MNTLDDILKAFPSDVKKAQKNKDLDSDSKLYMALYQHFQYSMPYGTAKARTDDPTDFLCRVLDDEGFWD